MLVAFGATGFILYVVGMAVTFIIASLTGHVEKTDQTPADPWDYK